MVCVEVERVEEVCVEAVYVEVEVDTKVLIHSLWTLLSWTLASTSTTCTVFALWYLHFGIYLYLHEVDSKVLFCLLIHSLDRLCIKRVHLDVSRQCMLMRDSAT